MDINIHAPVLKLIKSSVGRDKINRLVQYYCTTVLAFGKDRLPKEELDRLAKIQGMFAITRKVWRLGKQLEFISNIIEAKKQSDETKRLLIIMKNTGFGLWMICDALLLFNAQGIRPLEDAKFVGRRSYQFWLFGLVSSFALNFYEYRWNAVRLNQELKIKKPIPGLDDEFARNPVQALKSQRNNLRYALIQDLLDMVIPGVALEYLNWDRGYMGLAGTITSLMGIYTELKK